MSKMKIKIVVSVTADNYLEAEKKIKKGKWDEYMAFDIEEKEK